MCCWYFILLLAEEKSVIQNQKFLSFRYKNIIFSQKYARVQTRDSLVNNCQHTITFY